MSSKKIIKNKKIWDKVAEQFFGRGVLPSWGPGPFEVGKNIDLIGPVKNKIFLEIGFGSGHSINYLVKKGVKKIYGLDISEKQFDYASTLNKKFIENGKVKLFLANMEKRLKLPPIDIIYSIYGFGWTINPQKTLKNIYSYLKPGGKFIWSFDHSFFTDVEDKNGILIVKYSYHNEHETLIKNWRNSGESAYLTYRKTSTWFQLLKEVGFDVINYFEPKPIIKKNLVGAPPKKWLDSLYYTIKKAENVPCTMIWVCQKPKKCQNKIR